MSVEDSKQGWANEGKTLRLFSVHLPFVIVVALTQWREYGGKGAKLPVLVRKRIVPMVECI